MDTHDADSFAHKRAKMVQQQLIDRGLTDSAVLEAMGTVPRHVFVLPRYQQYAYDDRPLPIPANQTISQPYVVALMTSLLDLKPEDRVLEIGTGSGYAAAIISRIAKEVYTIERHDKLVTYACERLAHLGYDNVWVRRGDGTQGWPEQAPFDGIVVAAGGPDVPESLQQQLTVNGRLIMPVGRHRRQQWLVRVTHPEPDRYEHEKLSPVAFVPLIGEEGWED